MAGPARPGPAGSGGMRRLWQDEAVRIRHIEPGEPGGDDMYVRAYAFEASPMPPDELAAVLRDPRYTAGRVSVVAEDEAGTQATVSAVLMRQNLRGRVYPMAGIASVASHPLARRRGYVRALMVE